MLDDGLVLKVLVRFATQQAKDFPIAHIAGCYDYHNLKPCLVQSAQDIQKCLFQEVDAGIQHRIRRNNL